MTTKQNIINKILKQSQLMFKELSLADKDFNFSFSKSGQQQKLIQESTTKPDIVLFNNSFVFREDLKTKKSSKYLAISAFPKDGNDIMVATTDNSFNRDWLLRTPKMETYTHTISLSEAIDEELKELGEIIYVLIGNIGSPATISTNISNKNYKELIFDSAARDVTLDNQSILANPVLSDVEIWRIISEKVDLNDSDLLNLRLRFFETTEKLRKELVTPLYLPNENSDLESTFLDNILHSLSDEISDYEESLYKWQDNPDDEPNFNNILRISYNFSDDAIRILNLITNISDLKPILLWMTIYSQYMLRREFSKLERQKSDKPSLKEYDRLIKGARNARFHNMLQIKNTMKVNMEGILIQAKTMILFDEYSRRNSSVNFEYKDQKLIEILTAFTRAGEKSVSDEFWKQNLEIMKATCTLIDEISNSLKLLRLLK